MASAASTSSTSDLPIDNPAGPLLNPPDFQNRSIQLPYVMRLPPIAAFSAHQIGTKQQQQQHHHHHHHQKQHLLLLQGSDRSDNAQAVRRNPTTSPILSVPLVQLTESMNSTNSVREGSSSQSAASLSSLHSASSSASQRIYNPQDRHDSASEKIFMHSNNPSITMASGVYQCPPPPQQMNLQVFPAYSIKTFPNNSSRSEQASFNGDGSGGSGSSYPDMSNLIRNSLELCSDLSKFAYARISERQQSTADSADHRESPINEPYVRKAYELKSNIESFLADLSQLRTLPSPPALKLQLCDIYYQQQQQQQQQQKQQQQHHHRQNLLDLLNRPSRLAATATAASAPPQQPSSILPPPTVETQVSYQSPPPMSAPAVLMTTATIDNDNHHRHHLSNNNNNNIYNQNSKSNHQYQQYPISATINSATTANTTNTTATTTTTTTTSTASTFASDSAMSYGMDDQIANNSDLCAIRSRRPPKQLQKSMVKRRTRPAPQENQHCHSCNASETPEWRRGPDGPRTLCNACGLYYAKLLKRAKTNEQVVTHLPHSILTSRPLPSQSQSTGEVTNKIATTKLETEAAEAICAVAAAAAAANTFQSIANKNAIRTGWSCRQCHLVIFRGEPIVCRDGRKMRFMYHQNCYSGYSDPRTQSGSSFNAGRWVAGKQISNQAPAVKGRGKWSVQQYGYMPQPLNSTVGTLGANGKQDQSDDSNESHSFKHHHRRQTEASSGIAAAVENTAAITWGFARKEKQ